MQLIGRKIKAWIDHVPPVEPEALQQLYNTANLPFVEPHVAVMPDVHFGQGATVGSVIPTRNAIVPAAVGVDIGCGMIAARTNITANQLPDTLTGVRSAIESIVPVGRTHDGGKGDKGAHQEPTARAMDAWRTRLDERWRVISAKTPKLAVPALLTQLGTLGSGNHFIELCLDEEDQVWVMLHSGSRGVGNRIGSVFIAKAKEEMLKKDVHLPDKNLSYLTEDTESFNDYLRALLWAQDYAAINRDCMLLDVLDALRICFPKLKPRFDQHAISCHHNYVSRERHFGEMYWVTRKGAVSAQNGEYGIIPGAMGRKSYIVEGKGNPDSFCSCSHGAGRTMSRTEAKNTFTVEDHIRETAGVECRKDEGVLDETPRAYKEIDAVIASQSDLVRVVHTLRGVVVVKG